MLDASPGDRLVSYRYNIDAQQPTLEKVSDVTLSIGVVNNGSSSMGTITANNVGLRDFFRDTIYYGDVKAMGLNVEDYRGHDTRYYLLYKKNGGVEAYIDGSLTTDYPDYKIESTGLSDLYKIHNVGVEAWLKGGLECGTTYSLYEITDRYGKRYLSASFGLGMGLSVSAKGEGYVSTTGNVRNRTMPSMKNSDELENSIKGNGFTVTDIVGGGYSVGSGWFFWEDGNPVSFAYMEGMQASGSIEGFAVSRSYATVPSMGWQWALQAEWQGYGGKAYYRSDF